MPGAAFNIIAEIATDQHGYVTQKDARAAGVAAWTLARMAERGTIERVSQGVYRVPLIPAGALDEYMQASLWPRDVRGVLSHQTALELHGLSDVNPAKIHLSVPRAHRIQRQVPKLYVVHRADLSGEQVTALEDIPIVTPARAVLECFDAGLGPALIAQAIDDGRRRGVFSKRQAEQLRRETEIREVDR
ncbi:MAG: type IV toxin-antitoxin system AbiEi family antitoxin domain-containing protein [Solirubrobacteraceae bacterium]